MLLVVISIKRFMNILDELVVVFAITASTTLKANIANSACHSSTKIRMKTSKVRMFANLVIAILLVLLMTEFVTRYLILKETLKLELVTAKHLSREDAATFVGKATGT